MKFWNKRIFAGVLALCLMAAFLPMRAQAALLEDASPYITQQMLLGEDLSFRLQGKTNYAYAQNAVATIAYGDQADTYRLEDLTAVGDGLYAAIVKLAAAQMTEDIVLTVRVGGVKILQETYSIRDYVSALLEGDYSEETKQLCRELLNYGAGAQKYFEHRENDLADDGYDIAPQYSVGEELTKVKISGEVSGIGYYGTSVCHTTQTAVRHYFTGSVAGCRFTVDGVQYSPVSKDGMYYIEVPDVDPQDMETPMQVEVTNGADTLCVSYVPLHYFIRGYRMADDETTKDLFQAAYSYFKTAAAYEMSENWGLTGSKTEEPEAAPDDENLILGFDSYAEFTGARIAVGNQLGRMEINTDPSYIKQGKASLKVCPQGDYSVSGKEPYFKLDLLDSTCRTNDFSQYKQINFNVYNPQNKTLHINVGLVLGDDPDSYLTTIKQTIDLKPNGWTICSYDLSVMAGCGFYDLANVRYMTFSFAEYKQSKEDTPNVLYIDNLVGVPYLENEGITPVDFNFETGLDFEIPGHEYLFTGQGKTNDAVVERVRYYGVGVVRAPANGGSYGLRLSHGSDFYPTFRIHFGKVLPADTEITFLAYGRITSGTNQYNQSIFEFSSGGEATEQFSCNEWTELKITLTEPTDCLDLFWNYERAGITSTTASGEVYIDNIRATVPEATGDFAEGIDFEQIGHAERFTGQGNDTTDATIRRVTYSDIALAAPTDGGTYALQMSRDGSQTLSFRINFGRELAAGTVISFMAYGKITGNGFLTSDTWQFLYSSGSNATSSVKGSKWESVSITLSEAAEYIDLLWKFDRTGYGVSQKSGVLLMDNFKAEEPMTFTGDFTVGVGFEDAGDAKQFTGTGSGQDATTERVSYANAGVTAAKNGGKYALKLSHASNCWPMFRVNFGKTLKAGSIVTFDVYGNYDYTAPSGTNKYLKLELTTDSKKYATSDDSNQVVWTLVDTWKTATVTLTADTDHIDFMYNVADGQHGNVASWLLADNFLVKEAAENTIDITKGVSFEAEGDNAYFTGQGSSNDATIARVSYAAEGLTAPADGGSYALKLSHSSFYWPTFRINFGKTLKAGTKITFMAYGMLTSGTTKNNYSLFEYSACDGGGDATAQFDFGGWTEVTITLKADVECINLFWNIDRAGITSTTASGAVYIDNVKVTEAT